MGTEITINGTKHVVGGSVSYEQLVQLAGMKGSPSIAYSGPRTGDTRREGTVHIGQSITTQQGMNFTVIHTGNA